MYIFSRIWTIIKFVFVKNPKLTVNDSVAIAMDRYGVHVVARNILLNYNHSFSNCNNEFIVDVLTGKIEPSEFSDLEITSNSTSCSPDKSDLN